MRIQFFCEHRFHLQEKLGQKDTRASIDGSKLHDSVYPNTDHIQERRQIVPILIGIAAIIIGYVWIFG